MVQLIPNTTIMGEASVAFTLRNNGDRNRVLDVRRKMIGKFSYVMEDNPKRLKDFQDLYAPTLAKIIQESLEASGLDMEQIKYVIPHNVNISSWRKVAEYLNIPRHKLFLDNVSRLGHCFCSDPFINYVDLVREGKLQKGDHYMMVSVGLGATFAVSTLRH